MNLTAGRPREKGIALTLEDLEHLLIDTGRDGYFNNKNIKAVLRLRAGDIPAYVMPTTY
jgi:hypothetical protein